MLGEWSGGFGRLGGGREFLGMLGGEGVSRYAGRVDC